jgi:uncharacterized membrane protein YhdT
MNSVKKLYLEVIGIITFVLGATYIAYGLLAGFPAFWSSQVFWSVILSVGWVVVAFGYYHQGSLVRQSKSSEHVSIILPAVVFLVQCVLFVKGIYYKDWSLIAGALMVNSGVLFSLYQIITNRKR